ncbi:MAG: ATP-binding protein [Verrucomicrobiae bacterium]
MSSTRKAKDDSVFHQSRFASSPAIVRGLQAYLVALRCTALDSAADRELVWFLQYLSHREGGLAAVAKDLIAKFPDRIQTSEMIKLKATPGKMLSAEQVLGIRRRLPLEAAAQFSIKADFDLNSLLEDDSRHNLPASYPASDFFAHCRAAAASNLEIDLMEFCLNAADGFGSPWYFSGLPDVLREYQADFIKSKIGGGYVTALGQKVFEVLDYTAYCRGLTLIKGETRLGKSHAGRAWCEQHPGKARFVEVPSGNDEVTFFRDLARGLGLGNFLNYKVVQIRERVEYVLRTGDIILVLDEAQRLWPQTNFREGYPKRIAWVMTMANDGVPICMISTPQFFVTQKVVEKNGWNSAQLTGRISHYESLPQDLSQDDLIGVAKAVLPEADREVLRALAVYAQSSARYLAAIDSIAKRARYIATRDGRTEATAGDVRRAMKESVVPADTKLLCALGSVGGAKLPKIKPAPMTGLVADPELAPDTTEEILPVARRGVAPGVPGSRHRAGHPASLIEA